MALLNQALQQPAEEREGYLRAECGDEPELYQEVIEALYWEERMGSFLQQPMIEFVTRLRPFEPGETVAGRFTIVREIGEGGMGVVYEALDRKRNQLIAIKAAKPGFQRLLTPELEGALKVRHDNICLVNEIHTAETQHGPIDFLSMELLKGETLSAHLERVGKLDHEQSLDIARQLCAGLAQAHDSGILHRDLKCSNVLLCKKEDGTLRAVITDFGLATYKDLESDEMGGTPAYMAPELWEGEKATPASDIYALGVIMYEMVAGRRPHQKKDEGFGSQVERLSTLTLPASPNAEAEPASLMSVSQEAWRKHATVGLPPPPSTYTGGLDARWNRVIMRCLATDPAQRQQNAREVAAELTREPLPKWPFATVGVLVLLLTAVLAFVRPARQWVTDLIWPPNVRLAVLPYTGPDELRAIGSGALQEVAERIQQLPSSRRTVAVITPSRLADAGADTPERAREVLHATHALRVTVHPEGGGFSVRASVIDLNSQTPVKELSARYTQNEISALPAALTGLVSLALKLRGPLNQRALSPAATAPYLRGIYFLNRDPRSFEEAIAQFQQAARTDQSSALPPSGIALALVQKFRVAKQKIYLEQAREYVNVARSRDPDSPRVLLASAAIDTANGQYLRTLQDYRRIQELEPRNVEALLGLAATFETLHESDEAIGAYRKAEELDPEYYKPYYRFAAFYAQHGLFAEAADQGRKLVTHAPGLADAYSILGAALTELGQYAQAEPVLFKSLRVHETAQGLNNLGVMYYFEGKYKDAAAYQERALKYDPDNYIWLINLADNLRLAGRPAEARSYYVKARGRARLSLSDDPQLAYARACFAYTLARLGDRERALEENGQAINLSPDDNEVLENALETYDALGERGLAIETFRGLTLASAKELTHNPDLTEFFRDSRVKKQMLEKGGL